MSVDNEKLNALVTLGGFQQYERMSNYYFKMAIL